ARTGPCPAHRTWRVRTSSRARYGTACVVPRLQSHRLQLRLSVQADTAADLPGSAHGRQRGVFRFRDGAVAGTARGRSRRNVQATSSRTLMQRSRPAMDGMKARLTDIARQAWPVLIASWAGIAFGVIDTAMGGHAGALDLQIMALATSIYVTVFVGLMGVIH